jgi:hypothetical protein
MLVAEKIAMALNRMEDDVAGASKLAPWKVDIAVRFGSAIAGGIAERDKHGIIANSPSDVAEVAAMYTECLVAECAKRGWCEKEQA